MIYNKVYANKYFAVFEINKGDPHFYLGESYLEKENGFKICFDTNEFCIDLVKKSFRNIFKTLDSAVQTADLLNEAFEMGQYDIKDKFNRLMR